MAKRMGLKKVTKRAAKKKAAAKKKIRERSKAKVRQKAKKVRQKVKKVKSTISTATPKRKKSSVEIATQQDLVPTPKLIKAAVEAGELDQQMDAPSGSLRKGFQR